MEIKKTQTQPVAASNQKDKEAAAQRWRLRDFVGEIKEEIEKISWTSPQELKLYTQLVVGATFFFGMGIYALDLVIQAMLATLSLAIRYIAG